MISALRKIENRGELPGATSAVMELCLDNPREGFADLFATHPSVQSRCRCAGANTPGATIPARCRRPPTPTRNRPTEQPATDRPTPPPPCRMRRCRMALGATLPSPPAARRGPAQGPWGRHA